MSNSAFTPTTTQVTTEVPVNVPVVTAWQSYTPTFEGFGTPTAVSALWRRIGDSIEVRGQFTSGSASAALATISLPSGFNLDSTKLNGAQTNVLGSMFRSNSIVTGIPSGTRGPWTITESKSINTSKVYVSTFTDLATAGVFQVQAGNALTASGEILTFEFRAPISQWSSGTTTLADRAVEEYLSTSSFSSLTINRGPNGSTLPTTTPSGTFESISFGPNPWNTTWLPTDIVSIELDPFGNGKWTSISGSIELTSLTVQEASLTYIGLGFYFDGTNWILLRGKYRNPNSGNGVWSSASAGLRYRIKKVSSGAQVGYPISTKNIVGATDGVAPVTGMLGEVVNGSTDGATSMGSSGADKTISTITLSPGVWRIQTTAMVDVSLVTGFTRGQLTITTGSTTGGVGGYDNGDAVQGLNGSYHTAVAYLMVSLSATTTYNNVFKGTFTTQSGNTVKAVCRAIRIA
jgi:hypothetical protein